MSKIKRGMSAFQKFVDRVEPVSVLFTYLVLLWCAYFAWFYPPQASTEFLRPFEIVIQAMLFTLGGLLGLFGHISDRLFIEELGLISAFWAIGLYTYAIIAYVVKNGLLDNLGQILGVMVIAVLLLVNRAVKFQKILSAKWLKPHVSYLYDED